MKVVFYEFLRLIRMSGGSKRHLGFSFVVVSGNPWNKRLNKIPLEIVTGLYRRIVYATHTTSRKQQTQILWALRFKDNMQVTIICQCLFEWIFNAHQKPKAMNINTETLWRAFRLAGKLVRIWWFAPGKDVFPRWGWFTIEQDLKRNHEKKRRKAWKKRHILEIEKIVVLSPIVYKANSVCRYTRFYYCL